MENTVGETISGVVVHLCNNVHIEKKAANIPQQCPTFPQYSTSLNIYLCNFGMDLMLTVVPVQRSVSLDHAIWSCYNFQSLEGSYSRCINLKLLELLEAGVVVKAPVIIAWPAAITPSITLFQPLQMVKLIT
jgi:hypothetical protein